MKRLILIIVLFAATSATAQNAGIVSGGQFTTVSQQPALDSKSSIFSLRAGLTLNWFSFSGASGYMDDCTSKTGLGFQLQGIYEQRLTRQLPFYIQTGLGIALNNSGWGDDDDDDNNNPESFKRKFSIWYFHIPLAFNYKINIRPNFALSPYLGVNFNIGISGKEKLQVDGKEDGYHSEHEYKVFDKKEGDFQRFRPDFILGVNAEWHHFIVGIGASIGMSNLIRKDIVDLYESERAGSPKVSYTALNINIGYKF